MQVSVVPIVHRNTRPLSLSHFPAWSYFLTQSQGGLVFAPLTLTSASGPVSKGKPQLKRSCYLLQTNELQKMIKDRTRQMMALVAELSMQQALAIKLQQEMREKEQFLMTVSSRIDQGLPPPKETENEWLKILRNEKMQKEAAEARAKVSFCHVSRSDLQPHLLTALAFVFLGERR